MPGQLNPDKNLFSVAPIGPIIIIGRHGALKGGITREYALNLLTWLVISTDATPEEIKASVQDAMTPGPLQLGRKTMPLPQRTLPSPPPPPASKAPPQVVAPEVAGQVAPFIGSLDPEETQAILDAVPSSGGSLPEPPSPAKPVLPLPVPRKTHQIIHSEEQSVRVPVIDPAKVAGNWSK